ncbi:hypothetical protein HK104_004247 [Borealophlyctis nickersoniae]|nr:hypothetical protein HK104_004247 [Borealophlyctis nickersoniae]
MTHLNTPKVPTAKPVVSPSALMQQALHSALDSVGLNVKDINGIIAVPSLADPHFMEAHYFATQVGLLPGKSIIARTVDTGGAGPVTGLLEARRMIQSEGAELVAVVAGDAVRSLPSDEFLRRADQTCRHPSSSLPSPVIPSGYDRVAQYHMQKYGTTREQLAACSALMSIMASRHPSALTRTPHTVPTILSSPHVAPVTTILECARRADGAAALLVASSSFLARKGISEHGTVVVVGGGEASGPMYPPQTVDAIGEDMFSCEEACAVAFEEAQIGVGDVDFFGLYDCFPICLIRAIEAVGLAPKGQGGAWIEQKYHAIVAGLEQNPTSFKPQDVCPVNTHGGLLAFGAPWEVPAMFNIIESVAQLTGRAGVRQVRDARRAVVYGNGGIFSASAVAVLGRGRY